MSVLNKEKIRIFKRASFEKEVFVFSVLWETSMNIVKESSDVVAGPENLGVKKGIEACLTLVTETKLACGGHLRLEEVLTGLEKKIIALIERVEKGLVLGHPKIKARH